MVRAMYQARKMTVKRQALTSAARIGPRGGGGFGRGWVVGSLLMSPTTSQHGVEVDAGVRQVGRGRSVNSKIGPAHRRQE